jgi:hypothetical protein
MKLRKEYVILGALIVALSLYIFLRKGDRSRYELPVLPPIKTADITRIEIDTPSEQIELLRKSGSWVVGEKAYPADEDQVRKIADLIGKLTLTALISDSKNYARYELDEDRRISVKAWNNDQLVRSFDIGKTAPSFRHTFVRIEGDPRVYHGRENFHNLFAKNVDDLRDKRVLSFDQSQIGRIHLEGEEGAVTLVKAPGAAGGETDAPVPTAEKSSRSGVWQDSQGKTVDGEKLEQALKELAQLKCKAFIYGRSSADLGAPIYTVSLEGSETYTLSIFERLETDADDYPAVSSQNDDPFLVQSWRAERIMLDPADVRPPEAGEPSGKNEQPADKN